MKESEYIKFQSYLKRLRSIYLRATCAFHIFETIEKNSARLGAIELQMPNLSLASSWVFRAVLFIMALTGLTYLTMIIKGVGKQ